MFILHSMKCCVFICFDTLKNIDLKKIKNIDLIEHNLVQKNNFWITNSKTGILTKK